MDRRVQYVVVRDRFQLLTNHVTEAGLHQTLHTNVDLSNFAGANLFDVLYVSLGRYILTFVDHNH